MEEKAVRGVKWTLLSYAGSKGLTVLTTVALARILVPSDFGVMALALVSIGLLNLFTDMGLTGALVIRREVDERVAGTVFTMLLALSVAMTILAAASAPLVAALAGEPRVAPVLVALAGTLLFGGVHWYHASALQRDLDFGRRFAAQFVQAVSYAGVAIGAALAGAGVWSLVAGQIAGAVSYAVVLLAVARHHPRPCFDRAIARTLLRDSRGFAGQSGIAFLRQNVDYLAIGRTLGTAPLGYYSMAYRLGELPHWGIAVPVAQVTFPGFARMRNRDEPVGPALVGVVRTIALVCFPLGAILGATADPFIRTVLGDAWLAAVGPLAVLGIWAAVRPLETVLSWYLNALGHAGGAAVIGAGTLAVLVPGVYLAAELGGLTAVAWVLLGDVALAVVWLLAVARSRTGLQLGAVLGALRPIALAAAAAWLAAHLTAGLTTTAPAALGLLAAAACGVIAYVAALALLDRPTFGQAFGLAGRVLGRASAAPARG